MAHPEMIDEVEEDAPGASSRGSFILVGLLGLSALFGAFYLGSTYIYLQDSVPKGSKSKHLRVALKGLRFENGVAGPINYDTNAGVFLTRHGSQWIALEQTCPHQGCPVDWHAGAALFVCPCHNSEYDRLGNVVQGPSARGLYHHNLQVEPDAVVIEGRV